METRPYFVFGDLLTNALTGAVASGGASTILSGDWSPLAAMPLGMLLGMALSLPVAFAATPLFGALEVMLPAMLTGMMAGMLGGMLAAMGPLPWTTAAGLGSLVGLSVVAFVYYLTARAGRGDSRGRRERA